MWIVERRMEREGRKKEKEIEAQASVGNLATTHCGGKDWKVWAYNTANMA
jgi:hypothetical protein